MNYTKGEWKIGRYGNNRFEILNGRRIAIVDNWDDAHLISAAPELYKALYEAKGFVASPSVRIAVGKALAKAEMRQ